ncbi:hypothetical protein [Qipengyuania sp.]|uniref:hypothetical protein n=1 Tax=Qipengyuania sp. TaxID=2004515 RepID=UPI0035C79480
MSQTIDIIASAYRSLHEGEGYDALIAHWRARLEASGGSDPDLDIGGRQQLAALGALIERMPKPVGVAGIFHAIADAPGPAVVLSPELRVVAANEAGQRLFGARLGATLDLDWLDEDGAETLRAMASGADTARNRRNLVVRTYGPDGTEGLAELFPVRDERVASMFVAVRSLGVGWDEGVDALLQEAFGMTPGECEIARLLFEHGDPGAVSQARGTAIRTVRTQLHQIYQKTGCAGQVDLVRMLAALCARARERRSVEGTIEDAQPGGWRDPLGREAYFEGPFGQLAYSWMGRAGGRPAILAHAPFTGYILPQAVQSELEKADIQIFAPSRPGFGNSAATAAGDSAEVGAAVIGAMFDHLGLNSAPLIGLVNGFVPAIRFAADQPARVSRILNLGACLPLDTPELLADLPAHHRVLLDLATRSPRMYDLVMKLGYRMARARGPEFILARMYSGSTEDLATAFDPEILSLLMASASLLMAQDHSAILRDFRLITYPFGSLLRAAGPPIEMVVGQADPVFPYARVAAEAASNPRLTVVPVAQAGQTVGFARPDIASAAIKRLFDR